jgi:STE24 endopeptidase
VTFLAGLLLFGLLLEHALGVVADVLNLRHLSPEVPRELAHGVDAETFRRSQDYTRARTRFGWMSSGVSLAALLAFWGLGGFGWLDAQVRALALGPIPTGLAYFAALLLASTFLSLPFRWWSSFRIEERFGFNKSTARTFWVDTAKGLLLAAVLGTPLAALVLWLLGRGGDAAWLWCWGVAVAWSLALQYIAPTWIMPLFNRFEPLEQGELRTRLEELARETRFPLTDVFVIDGSRRSTKANAFFTGLGRQKRIALFDTLVERHPTSELVAVLAHEIGHWRRGHVWKGTLLGVVQLGAWMALLGWALESEALFAAFGVEQPSIHVGLVLFGVLTAPANLVLGPLFAALSRRHEFEADAFAARATGRPADLEQALVRLSRESLSNLTPHPFYVWLHYSHPPLLARIAALRAA